MGDLQVLALEIGTPARRPSGIDTLRPAGLSACQHRLPGINYLVVQWDTDDHQRDHPGLVAGNRNGRRAIYHVDFEVTSCSNHAARGRSGVEVGAWEVGRLRAGIQPT